MGFRPKQCFLSNHQKLRRLMFVGLRETGEGGGWKGENLNNKKRIEALRRFL